MPKRRRDPEGGRVRAPFRDPCAPMPAQVLASLEAANAPRPLAGAATLFEGLSPEERTAARSGPTGREVVLEIRGRRPKGARRG